MGLPPQDQQAPDANPNPDVALVEMPQDSSASRAPPVALSQVDILDDADALAGQDDMTQKLAKNVNKGKSKVDKENLLMYVQTQEEQKQVFLQLPFSILYFSLFIVMCFGHMGTHSAAMLNREHRSMLAGTTYEGVAYTSGHKDIGDIDTKEDIYTFLNEVVAPMYIMPYCSSYPATPCDDP